VTRSNHPSARCSGTRCRPSCKSGTTAIGDRLRHVVSVDEAAGQCSLFSFFNSGVGEAQVAAVETTVRVSACILPYYERCDSSTSRKMSALRFFIRGRPPRTCR